MDIILTACISAVVSVAIYAVVTNLVVKTSIRKRRETAIKEAEAEGEMIKKERILQAKEKFIQLKSEYDRQVNERNQKIAQSEQRAKQIEQNLQNKERDLENRLRENERLKEQMQNQLQILEHKKEEIVEVGKRTAIDLGIHGLHPELIRMIGKMKYRSSYGQNLLQHARETANLAGIMAAELGLNPKIARRAGLLHDIGKVPDDEPELPHAIIGMKLAEKYKEKPEVCNAIGAHHDEVEMTSLIAPIIQVCDAISGARPGARREVVESYIKRLKEMEDIALSYPGVLKTYAIQAGRELRVIVGADKLSDQESEGLSHDIAKKIQDEMTYPGQVKITVIRETRAVAYAK